MVINTNISALMGARQLAESTTSLSKSLARLSSGSKLASAEDDAAGLAMSIRFDAQTSRLGAAQSNVSNAVSFAQTQDGFLKKVGKALDRMSELSLLALDATKTDGDRNLYNAEFGKLASYITDLATKDFNGVTLFNGAGLAVTTDAEGKTVATSGVDLTATAYTAATGANVGTVAGATSALTIVKAAIAQLTVDRANVGANISMLNSYNDQLGVLKDSIQAANSRIKDVDVAQESATYAKYNILVQAGTAMLAQANQAPQAALKLLQ